MTTLYVVGRRGTANADQWSVLGIYDDRELAVRRCKIVNRDFVMPVELNVDAPEDDVVAPGSWYPLAL